MLKLWWALVIATVACGGDRTSSGEEAAALIEEWWRDHERLAPGDEFSADERNCITEHAASVDLDTLESAADGAFDERTAAYLAPYADECVTDEHLEEYLRVDAIFSGLRVVDAECRAPRIVDIVREHGFAAVLAENRAPSVRADFEALDEQCE